MVTLSSSEAEYVALSACSKQIVNTRRVFLEFLLNQPINTEPNLSATQLQTDSKSGISIATREQVSERNKHIEIKVHYIKDQINKQVVYLKHKSTHEMPADILTKSVQPFVLAKLLQLYNM